MPRPEWDPVSDPDDGWRLEEPPEPTAREIWADERRELVRRHRAGESATAIAARLGVQPETVRRRLLREGVDTSTPQSRGRMAKKKTP